EAPTLTAKFADAEMNGSLKLQTSEADQQVHASGSLNARVPSVRNLVAVLKVETPLPRDPATLGPLDLSTQWDFADGAITAKPVSLHLDGIAFTGWVERSRAPRDDWRFELHGDRIDLGRYVDVESAHPKPFELPVDALKALRANGVVTFEQAQLADAHMKDIRL